MKPKSARCVEAKLAEPAFLEVVLVNTIPVKNKLGEGVLYHHPSDSVWWTDIKSSQLFRYCLATEALRHWSTPFPVCSFGFTENDHVLVAAFDRGFALYNPFTDAITWLSQPETEYPGNRFNDGKMDKQGRFFAGTMVETDSLNPKGVKGALYCLDNNGDCRQVLNGISISNGLCWSPDGKFVYHTDSPTQQIMRYRYDNDIGSFFDKTLFATTEKHCFPDGSTIDNSGCLWNAQWGGAQVICYSPEGRVIQKIAMPVSQPTCVALGGRNFDLLFVTSATDGLSSAQLSKEPLAGDLFIYKVGKQGVAESCSALHCSMK